MNRYIYYFLLYNYTVYNQQGYLKYILSFSNIVVSHDLNDFLTKYLKLRNLKTTSSLHNDVMRQYVSSMMTKHVHTLVMFE